MTYTCITCGVGFSSGDDQRIHYKSDWHRYNLKRKVAGMVPVSAEGFRDRVLAQQAEDKMVIEAASEHTVSGLRKIRRGRLVIMHKGERVCVCVCWNEQS